jgi:uncharacterized protein (DUF3820 family)
MIMTFGAYKGRLIQDLKPRYLKWLIEMGICSPVRNIEVYNEILTLI